LKEEIAMTLLLDIVAGQISPLYKELLDDGIINGTFATEFFNGFGYYSSMFSGESSQPEIVAEKIKDRIAALKKKGITKEQFEMVRKKQYGKTVRAFTDIDTIANALIISHFENEELFEEFNVIKSMELDFVNDLLNKCFDKDKSVLSVVKS
jgi:predicted Zn-dependent peptidase